LYFNLKKNRVRDVKVLKNVKVYFKWVWNKSQFDTNTIHFDGRTTTIVFNDYNFNSAVRRSKRHIIIFFFI